MHMEDQKIREDARKIMDAALHAALPDTAVEKALAEMPDASGRLILVAAGKAAWQMAAAAYRILGERIDDGIVITKHGHAMGAIGNLTIREAGHPVPDADSYNATEAALTMTAGLKVTDTVLFLLSGGGSALFEKPLIPPEEMDDITRQLLACGADIVEINTLRKRLSAVKGGKFAQHAAPARVYSVVLSDILGDPLDMIASGPAYPDSSTAEQARARCKKVRAEAFGSCSGAAGQRNPEAVGQCDHPHHRLRPAAVRRGVRNLPDAGLYPRCSDGITGL